MFNINIPIISKLISRNKNLSDDSKSNHKQWCEHRDKYVPYWNKAGEYIEAINENYSLFINNDLSNYYFSKLLLNCNNYIKIAPILVESQKEENVINKTNNKIIDYNIGYHKLILAYEKMGQYHKAIEMCEEAITQGFPNDKTKYGLVGRIERIKKKINTR